MSLRTVNTYLLSLLFLVFSTKIHAQLSVFDCESRIPIQNASLYNLHSELLGKTNDQGLIKLSSFSFPVFLQADGYELLTISDSVSLSNICMLPITVKIEDVVVKSKRLTVAEYLLSLYHDYQQGYLNKDTIVYYRLSYLITFPDSNWNEATQGYVAYKYHKGSTMSLRNIINDISIVQNDYKSTNTEFKNSKSYKKTRVVRPLLVLTFEMMSDFLGATTWALITNPNSRKLALRRGGGEEIFSSYSLRDRAYVLEKVAFNENHILKSVDYFTPNLFNEDDSNFLIKPYDFAEKNTENSFYHTSYNYSTSLPYILESVVSHCFFVSKRNNYAVDFKLELVDFVPEHKCNIEFSKLSKGSLK